MGLMTLVLAWPILILIGGFVIVALLDSTIGGYGRHGDYSGILTFPLIIIGLFVLVGYLRGAAKRKMSTADQSEQGRRVMIVASLAVLIPLFVRQLIFAGGYAGVSSISIFLGLIIGFGVMIWGAFIKDNWVVSRANITGGLLTALYVYYQLWQLGPGMRIAGAALGLVAAVGIAMTKFKDKLA